MLLDGVVMVLSKNNISGISLICLVNCVVTERCDRHRTFRAKTLLKTLPGNILGSVGVEKVEKQPEDTHLPYFRRFRRGMPSTLLCEICPIILFTVKHMDFQ